MFRHVSDRADTQIKCSIELAFVIYPETRLGISAEEQLEQNAGT